MRPPPPTRGGAGPTLGTKASHAPPARPGAVRARREPSAHARGTYSARGRRSRRRVPRGPGRPAARRSAAPAAAAAAAATEGACTAARGPWPSGGSPGALQRPRVSSARNSGQRTPTPEPGLASPYPTPTSADQRTHLQGPPPGTSEPPPPGPPSLAAPHPGPSTPATPPGPSDPFSLPPHPTPAQRTPTPPLPQLGTPRQQRRRLGKTCGVRRAPRMRSDPARIPYQTSSSWKPRDCANSWLKGTEVAPGLRVPSPGRGLRPERRQAHRPRSGEGCLEEAAPG